MGAAGRLCTVREGAVSSTALPQPCSAQVGIKKGLNYSCHGCTTVPACLPITAEALGPCWGPAIPSELSSHRQEHSDAVALLKSSTGMRHTACSARRHMHTCTCTRLPPWQLLQLYREDFHGASRMLSKGWGERLWSSRYPAWCRGLGNLHMPGLGCSNTGGGHSLGTCIKAQPELFLLGDLRRLFQRQTIVHKQVPKLTVSKLGCWVVFALQSVPVCHQWRCLVLLECKIILGILPFCRNTLAGHKWCSIRACLCTSWAWLDQSVPQDVL